ncbi:MAG: SH3 domain-containing protein [Pseudomonadota bacterium]
MARFMIVTFLLLGWGFFELSGGTSFVAPEPEPKPLNALLQDVADQEDASVVARAETAPEGVVIVGQPRARAQGTASPTPETTTLASFTQEPASSSLATILGTAPESIEPVIEEVAAPVDLRSVTGSRVNMRNGPGTNFQVLTQLVRGDEAEVLQSPGDGWVKIRATGSGRVGWMAERLLAPVN